MIVHADILKWAETYDGDPFHAALMDCPYEYGFMSRSWDATGISYQPSTWAAIARHLHPGAFGMTFGGARSWHRIACAIEDAGLILHPDIYRYYAYGSGFPKASRLDTIIDRRAGVERTKIGSRRQAGAKFKLTQETIDNGGFNDPSRSEYDVTAPATEMARDWQGHRYGLQAIKPAVEPIIIFQKPYDGPPVESMVRTGAGALWIDGSRVMPEGRAHDEPVYTLRSSRGSSVYTGDPSLESCRDSLLRIAVVMRGCSTDDTDLLRNEVDQDDMWPAPAVYESLLARLYPNGVWCELDWSAVLNFPGDCLSCRRSYGELLRPVQEAARSGAPPLADALEHICYSLPVPSHSPCSNTARPSSDYFASSLVELLLGDDEALRNTIIPYSAHPYKRKDDTSRKNSGRKGGSGVYGDSNTYDSVSHPAGRWPANLALCHLPDCNGDCAPGCPVSALGAQSGDNDSRPVRPENIGKSGSGDNRGIFNMGSTVQTAHYDTGTAARFFYQSDWQYERLEQADPVGYFAKASRSEREAGLNPEQTKLLRDLYGIDDGGFEEDVIDDGREMPIDNPYQRGETKRRNIHPTVKPISLNLWLARLLLPPARYAPRRLLIPFCGVGSEILGAMFAGWEEIIGVELEEQHVRIGEARIRWWQTMMRQTHSSDPGAILRTYGTTGKAKPSSTERWPAGSLFEMLEEE